MRDGKIGQPESKEDADDAFVKLYDEVAPSGAEEIKQHEHCKNCGFAIPIGAIYCDDCSNDAD